MDKVAFVSLLFTLLFILLGVFLNYPRKGKKETQDDSGFVNQSSKQGNNK
jgi:hypothetical protein